MESLRSGRAGAGEWIGVLSDQVVAVLPPQSADLAAQLWVAVDAGADFEEALDQVLRHGLAAVPSLVLAASGAEGALRLLVRGTPSVQVHLADGTTRLIASGAGVWREDVLDDVQGLEVELGAGVWPSEPAGPGLRRLGAWAAGTAALADSLADSVADSVAVADASGAAQPVVLAASADEVPTHGPDGAGEDELIWETAPLAAVPEWGDPAPATTGTPGPAASPAPGVGAATPGGVEAGWTDDDQATDVIMSVEDAPTEVVVPGGAAHPPTPVPTRVQPVARMTFAHGLVLDLVGPVVVGRAPMESASAFPEARTVTVPSPLGEVSANHLELYPGVGPQAGSVMVVDLGSTNGSVVRRPGRQPITLVPGAPLSLAPGDTVDLGDGASLRVGPL